MASQASPNEIFASLKRQFLAHNLLPSSALLHLVNGVSVLSLVFPKLTSLVASDGVYVINVPPTDVAELMSKLQHKDPNMTIKVLCRNLVCDNMKACLYLCPFSTRVGTHKDRRTSSTVLRLIQKQSASARRQRSPFSTRLVFG